MAEQREFDFSDGARLEAHLQTCGLSPLQARFCALVFREGAEQRSEDRILRVLTISHREAARKLRGTPSSVRRATLGVATLGLVRIVLQGRRRPALYVLDVVAARALVPLEECLDEVLGAAEGEFGAAECAALRRGAPSLRRGAPSLRHSPLVLERDLTKPPCSPVLVLEEGVQGESEAARRKLGANLAQGAAVRRLSEIGMPWARRGGFSNDELASAVGGDDVAGLEHVFDEAVSRGWIRAPRDYRDGSDVWLRFLMLARRVARTKCRSKRAVMQCCIERGVDATKCSCADEDWAARLMKLRYRDPKLARESCPHE